MAPSKHYTAYFYHCRQFDDVFGFYDMAEYSAVSFTAFCKRIKIVERELNVNCTSARFFISPEFLGHTFVDSSRPDNKKQLQIPF